MGIYAVIILILIVIYTFFTGFNDGANAIATTVATRAVKPRTAVIIAAVTKFVVPILIFVVGNLTGTLDMSVAGNIGYKTIYVSYFEAITQQKAFVFMLSAMAGTLVWGVLAYILRIPISTSHTLIGGLIGAGIAAFGFYSILWKEYVLVYVLLMVMLAPVMGLVFSYLLMKIFKRLAKVAHKSVNNLLILVQRINIIVLAASFASNNAQKGLGIFLMMGSLGLYAFAETPLWIVVIVAGALTLGMLLGGYRVINTLGRKIFKMHDLHSVVAQSTTSAIMIAATELGIAISTGQLMASSIMGVGAAERASGVKWKVALRIAISWFLTLPISAIIGAVFYLALGAIMKI